MAASTFSESCAVHVDLLGVCSRWSLSGKTPMICLYAMFLFSTSSRWSHLSLWWSCHLRCNLFLLFLLRIWSIDLCQMAGAEAIQSTRRLCRFNPWWVLIVKHSCDSSSISIWWYACLRSILVNFLPPPAQQICHQCEWGGIPLSAVGDLLWFYSRHRCILHHLVWRKVQ